MPARLAQFVHATHDVVDEAFLREFPEIEVVKADSLETLSAALQGAEILHVYNSAFTPEFAKLVRDKGRALKWIQFTTVGIDIALKAGLPDGVWVTNSGDVSQRVLAGHAIALMLGVMRGFRRFEPLRARHDYARKVMPRYMSAPDGARLVIFGMGRIGQDIARKAKAFDMEVICVTRAAAPAVPEIDRVVPMSPNDLERKKLAIFRHQSQKDRAMYPGSIDRREFWQRAEDRNRNTAKVFDKLGLHKH